jgi:hypothetical protein
VTTTDTNGAPVYSIPSGTTSTTTASQSSSTGQGSQNNVLAFVATVPASFSHLDNIARQPITLTGFVLLPIFAALLFGFVLYRVSRMRNGGRGTSRGCLNRSLAGLISVLFGFSSANRSDHLASVYRAL